MVCKVHVQYHGMKLCPTGYEEFCALYGPIVCGHVKAVPAIPVCGSNLDSTVRVQSRVHDTVESTEYSTTPLPPDYSKSAQYSITPQPLITVRVQSTV